MRLVGMYCCNTLIFMKQLLNQLNPQKVQSADESLLVEHREALKTLFPINLNSQQAKKTSHTAKATKAKLAAKGLGLLSVLLAATVWLDPAYQTEVFSTAVGARQTITLADQSSITLNTQTQLAVHTHLRSRRISLVNGQALFSVKHHPYKAFYVDAGQTQVRVVGTKFDVFKQLEHVTVTVLRGKVLVTGNTRTHQYNQTYLTQNQQINVNNGEVMRVKNIEAAKEIAWIEGKLIFERTPLKLALAEVQRYNLAPIVLDTKVATLKISGVFNTNETNTMLNLLPSILPVKVITSPTNKVTITAK